MSSTLNIPDQFMKAFGLGETPEELQKRLRDRYHKRFLKRLQATTQYGYAVIDNASTTGTHNWYTSTS